MIIIPAIDLHKGNVVRLLRGEYDKEILYSNDPVGIATQWQAQGAERLHIVDLEWALKGTITSQQIIQDISNAIDFPIEFGGGVRGEDDIKMLLNAGVSSVILGTKACKDEEFLKEMIAIYKEKIIVGVDAKNGIVSLQGWTESSGVDSIEFVQHLEEIGVQTVIYTDIARDGMLSGHNIIITEKILQQTDSINLIASGGVSTLEDIKGLKALAHPRLYGVIVGRALYENQFSLEEALAC